MQDKEKSHDQRAGNPLDDVSRGSEKLYHSLSAASARGKDIFPSSEDMSLLMRNLDWSATPIGPVENWSQSLRTSVSICLASRFPILIWWGSELVMIYNDAYRPILGTTKHPQALGQRGRECWAEIWHVIGPMLEGVLTTGDATWSDDQLLLLDRNGYIEECYFTFSYSPILDDTGVVGGIFTAVKETTERVLSERRLSTLRELADKTANAKTIKSACRCAAQTLATNPADIPFTLLYLLDEAGKQAQLMDAVGLTDEVLARCQIIDINPENNNTLTSLFARVVQTGQAEQVDNLAAQFDWDFLSTAPDFPNSALVLPIIAQANPVHPAGLLIIGISPRRAFDKEYRGFFELIAGHIATAIANARAYEVERKRAEALAELDRAKTTFFSNISHEFRTPLTLIISPLEDLLTKRTDLLPPEEFSQLQAVHRNSLRLLKLVNSLLDFSRIEAGRVQAVYEPTDLAMLTTDLAGVFRSAIERAGMRLVVDCFPLPEPAYVDRQMWEKIVLNLLSNAFKFTFEGEIEVSLRWAHDHIELKVRDTGIGIPALELPHIFERFHRVQGARGRTNEGSGIGLSLVQELIKLHGGNVQLTSVVNEGTSFIVSIPTGYAHLPSERIGATRTLASTAVEGATYVEEALGWLSEVGRERAEALASALSLPVPMQTLQHTPTARILLADDNADMRNYVERLLLSQQYQVETVTDGIAALAAVREQMPDLILSDVMMPRLDGLGLLRELRADPQTREIPIILLSARAGEESRIAGLETGADDYLIKPFSARELLARVEANLKLARMRQETARCEQQLRIEAETAHSQIRNILESISDAFVAFDRQWRYTYVNEQAARLLQKTPEDLLGKQVWTEVYPETVGTLAYQELHRAVSEQVAVVFEEFSQPIGKWLEIHAYPSPKGVAVYFRDITERKHSEEALRQSEARYQTLVANLPGMVYRYKPCKDSPESFKYVSSGSRDLFELEPETILQDASSIWQLIHPDDLQSLQDSVAESALNSLPWQWEGRIITPSGQLKWIQGNSRPMKTASEEVWDGLLLDITARKQAESALQESEDRLRLALESAELGIWDFNPKTGVLTWDVVCKAMFGLSPDGLVNYEVFLAGLHPEDHDRTHQVVQQALNPASNGEYNIEYRTIGIEDGVERWIAAQGKAYFNSAGEAVRFIGTVLNITERKRIAVEREQLLERERAARAEAETANRVKDEFLAVLSHELRSPLNPILGWSKLLRSGKLDQKTTDRALETIERNAKVQTQLIEDLLDISRILQGKLRLDVSPVDLVSTIQAAIETVYLAAQAKSIQIQPVYALDVMQVLGDANRLQQVVWNLLSNAVKFTDSGGRVEIRLERIGTDAQIQVSDTGKGIHPDFLPCVFDYFRQENSTTTRKFGGLGLGLAIVRKLTELHGGTVQAFSQGEGLGATFTVRLPLMKVEQETSENKQVLKNTHNIEGVRLLIVDDDVDTLEFLAFLLKQDGAQVRAVASAHEALEVFAQWQPEILLSDIGMPEVDGYTLIRQIRAMPSSQGGQIPAIALTAYAGETNHQQVLQAGFHKHITKPVDPLELTSMIATLVKEIRTHSQF